MKKITKNFLLVMTMVLICFAVSVGASALDKTGQCGDDVYWDYNKSTKELVISGNGDMWNYNGTILIDGILYTPSPFYESDVKTIIIKKGVTSIGDRMFEYCESLTNVTIPDSIKRIGEHSFWGCDALPSVTIPDSVIEICEAAFTFCSSMSKVTIGKNVKTIAAEAFEFCTSLKNITIPDSVETIGTKAFNDTGVQKINIPDSVTSIGDSAFGGIYYLTKITVDKNNKFFSNDKYGVLFNKDKTELLCYPSGNTNESYVIPDGVKTIAPYAFEYVSYLREIEIPDSVLTIGEKAFYHTKNLSSITIPSSVTSIGNNAIYGCRFLEKITVDKNNANYSSDTYGVLFNKDKTVLLRYPENNAKTAYTIPETVKTITESAFEDCTRLTSVVIPDGVESINTYAFYDCEHLASVNMPNSVTTMGDDVFGECTSLTSIVIPYGIKTIEFGTFFGCKSLESITVPSSVTFIDAYAFDECKSVSDVYYQGTEKQWNEITITVGNKNLTNANIHFCSCACHKNGIANFFFNIFLSFNRIFGINRTCKCGVAHY